METHDLIVRYFEGQIIGSFLFVKWQTLKVEDINDIDIAVLKPVAEKVRAFLNDQGYKEETPPREDYYKHKFDGDYYFTKTGSKPIHILPVDAKIKAYTPGELIGSKYSSETKNDLEQLKKVIDTTIEINTNASSGKIKPEK